MKRVATLVGLAALVCMGCGSGLELGPVKKINVDCGIDCDAHGECTLARGDRCIASSNAECKKSHICVINGKCTARDGQCVAASDEDCKNSQDCTDGSKCYAVAGRCDTQQSASASGSGSGSGNANANANMSLSVGASTNK